MHRERDPVADDCFLDQCLREELAGETPPDLSARIAATSAARGDLAVAAVDAAAIARRRVGRQQLLLAVAASLFVGLATWAAATGAPPADRGTARLQALLDEFHRVMPACPATLRDAARRAEIAAEALPAIRAILESSAEPGAARELGGRRIEFEVYAAELGDAAIRAVLRQRADAGDPGATAVLTTATIATTEGASRQRALGELAGVLARHADLAPGIVQAIATAELTPAEAEELGTAIADRGVRSNLVQSAHLAAAGPRRLLGRPLHLSGRLVDDRWFDTAALQGRPVLVCFWASWCGPCRPVLEQVRQVRITHPELAVVAVSCDSEYRTLAAHLARHRDLDWIQFFDKARPGWHHLASAFGVQSVPFLMLLDRDGIVRDVDLRGDLERAVQRILRR